MDADLKAEAEGILEVCGLNATQGINLVYRIIGNEICFARTGAHTDIFETLHPLAYLEP